MILIRLLIGCIIIPLLGFTVYRAIYSFSLSKENAELQKELDILDAKVKAYEDTNPTANWDNF